jgi:hypothetical protein
MPRDNAESIWFDSSSPKLQSRTCQHCQNDKENNAGLVVGEKQHKHKNEKIKGTFNKRGAKIQSCYCLRVVRMKWMSVNSANKGNRSNNLGGTIMAAAG